ncbi:MAG: hypothetical protein FWG38_07815 [Defluviitaleaceae bacterium]|nr:hypothetical protein [Defluviitaleaceae bacterium]
MERLLDLSAKQYNMEPFRISKTHDSSRGDDDMRYTYILASDSNRMALKIAKNTFTTPERVAGWAMLANHYDNLGIYTPKFLKTIDGAYSFTCDGFTIYAEECVAGKTVDDWEAHDESVKLDALKTLAIVATTPAPIVPWKTSWCLYDLFDESDSHDENMECAMAFTSHITKQFPAYSQQTQQIFNRYVAMRSAFEAEYRALPKAVFQGDLNPSNLVLADDGKFKGLYDFNLSGTETILNMLFCECCECWRGTEEEKAKQFANASYQMAMDKKAAERLAYVGKYYQFSPSEKMAFMKYFNITYPFRWVNFGFYMYHLDEIGEGFVPVILNWIETQMTRQDVGFMIPG